MFEHFITQWGLVPDGKPVVTSTASLLPVQWRGRAAMLKLSLEADQTRGAALMEWWNGDGAAQVFARDGNALLMERATGTRSLADMARAGNDADACRILCQTASQLHRQRPGAPPGLVPLDLWFADLEPAARAHGGLLAESHKTARLLLSEPADQAILHGDLHHGNVLDFGARGWRAIDPHALIGERGFDFANIFTNPDLADPKCPVATRPGCFHQRLDVVATAAGLPRHRLLQWILAWAGLSVAWFLADNDPLVEVDLAIAALAAAELSR